MNNILQAFNNGTGYLHNRCADKAMIYLIRPTVLWLKPSIYVIYHLLIYHLLTMHFNIII